MHMVFYYAAENTDGISTIGIHAYQYRYKKPSKGIGITKTVATNQGYRNTGDDYLTIDGKDIPYDKPCLVEIVKYINYYKRSSACQSAKDIVDIVTAYIEKKHPDSSYLLYDSTHTKIKKSLIPQAVPTIDFGTQTAQEILEIAKAKTEDSEGEIIIDKDYYRAPLSIHPLISLERLYYNGERYPYQGFYYLANVGSVTLKKTEQTKDKYLGKELPDACLSVVKLKDSDSVIETIKKSQHQALVENDYCQDVLCSVNLTNVKVKHLYNRIHAFKEDSFTVPNPKHPQLYMTGTNQAVSYVLDPPYLSFRALTELLSLEDILNQFIKGSIATIEITDKVKTLEDHVSVDKVILSYGIDLPTQETIKRLCAYHPRYYFYKRKVDDFLSKYYTIVVLDDESYAIYHSPYSGIYLHE